VVGCFAGFSDKKRLRLSKDVDERKPLPGSRSAVAAVCAVAATVWRRKLNFNTSFESSLSGFSFKALKP
jgi:hypothetical protein